MSHTCTTCTHYQYRYNNRGVLAYTFCSKSVNQASATFSCIWHTTKGA